MLGVYISTLLIFIFGTINVIGIRPDLLVNQLSFFGLGLVAFVICKYMQIQFFRQNARFFYWLFVSLLIITYIVGIEVKGSQRWIDLYVFRFQPSEFFKIFFIVFIADYISKLRHYELTFELFLKGLAYTAIPLIIIFKQPDLATSIVYFFIFVCMILFSGMSRRYMMYFIAFGAILLPIMWGFLHDYQRNRIIAFVNPQVNQESTSYNMTQAIITSGSGQLFGRGMGLGKQANLYFLPEYHTDFAFSSLVEQFGFIGGGIVILLYMSLSFFLIIRLIELYRKNDEKYRFQFLYTLGFFSFLVFQVFVNIGMNLGILPIAGITLPLISYGGSSLITLFIGLALL